MAEDSEPNFSSTAFPDADEREISFESAETSELVFARQNAETVNLQGEIVPKRNISGREILLVQPSPAGGGHGSIPRFQHNPEPTSSSTTQMSTSASRACENELQVQLNEDVDKAGLCIICSCTEPYNGEHIEYYTAPEKMAECFQMKLGYSLYEVKNVSKSRMETLLSDLSNLKLPSTSDFRILFYCFGHGTENEICLKDGNFERSKIITALQNISKDMVRMVLFDSCRLVSKVQSSSIPIDVPPYQYDLNQTMEKPIQAVGSLPGRSDWNDIPESSCPDCFNMLVINATDYSGRAYYAVSNTYPDIKGCGLVTYFFTRLVAEMNQPLVAVLVEVRNKVDDFLKKETNRCPDAKLRPQVLMYQDRTIERVNLLAESKGTERVKPEIVHLKPSVLTTIVQWVFRLNVDGGIKTFRVRCQDEKGNIMEINAKLTLKNVAKFENRFLKSNTEYKIQVAAVYNDGHEAWSEQSSFVTPGGGHGSIPRFQHNPEPTSSSTTQMSTSASRACDVPTISGADIVAEMKLDVTPGKPLTHHWEDHGFKIHIPPDAISDDIGPVALSIQASLSGKYQLPDNDHVLVSGVYWLALHPHVKFVKEVTITIQHCGSKDANSTSLSFVKAKTQSTLPYIFKPMPGGSFSDSQKNGVIKIDHFCGIAVSGKQNSFYALCTYYLHKQLNVYETHITVTPDLELQLKDVRDTYKNKEKSEEGPTEVAKINSGEISYEIQDPAGVGIPQRMWEKDGWELFPLIKATLQKEFLDHYEPGIVIPHFEISLKCGDARQSLSQMVTFTGVESETFITILRHPALSEQGTSQTANNATGTTTDTTYTGSLDIDKDGPSVKEPLKPLNKDELKELFTELGLSNATLTNRYTDSRAAYLDDLVRAWLQERDGVLNRGGATWKSLKRALQRLGHNGIAANITPSTADSSSITRRSMREDISHGSSQSPDQSLQLTTSNTQLMTQDEPHSVRSRKKEQPSSSHNQNDEGVVQTNTHHDSSQQQKDLKWFLVMIIMLVLLLVGMIVIGYYVFFRES